MSHCRRHRDPDDRPLLSVCTILILSGFLLGFATSEQFNNEMRLYMYSAGFLGILSFLALDHVRNRRRLQREAIEQMLVEERLERHVDSCMSWGDLRRDSREFRQLEELETILDAPSTAVQVAS